MNNEDSFVFYPTFYCQLESINSEAAQLALYKAIARYGVYGETPDFSNIDEMGYLDAVFIPIKNEIDRAKERRKVKQDAGRLGGKTSGGNPNFHKGEPNPYYGTPQKDKAEIKQDKAGLSYAETMQAEAERLKANMDKPQKDKAKINLDVDVNGRSISKENTSTDKEKVKEKSSLSHSHSHKRNVEDALNSCDPILLEWMLDPKNNISYIPRHYTHLVTTEELDKLEKKYKGKICETISAIENRTDLRSKYSNLYRTLLNWLKNNP